MSRVARVVLPHMPHHVVQRGHNRQVVFAGVEDCEAVPGGSARAAQCAGDPSVCVLPDDQSCAASGRVTVSAWARKIGGSICNRRTWIWLAGKATGARGTPG